MKEFILKYHKVIMKFMCFMFVVAALVGGCSLLNKKLGLEDDNIIEEALEQELKERTGVELDLSPSSKEQ